MKRLLLNFAMTSLLLAAAPAASASPDITDLLKGAAWNSVQIAETLHERGLVRPTADLKFELK